MVLSPAAVAGFIVYSNNHPLVNSSEEEANQKLGEGVVNLVGETNEPEHHE